MDLWGGTLADRDVTDYFATRSAARAGDRLGKLLIVDRLGDVDVAPQLVAPRDLALVIGVGEDGDGLMNALEVSPLDANDELRLGPRAGKIGHGRQVLMKSKADNRSAPGAPALSRSGLRVGIRGAVGKNLDLTRYRVFLFGSEASGTAAPGSDVDVGIWGPEPIAGAILARIQEELENLRTLRLFDVVDFARTDETFRSVALRGSEPLNDP